MQATQGFFDFAKSKNCRRCGVDIISPDFPLRHLIFNIRARVSDRVHKTRSNTLKLEHTIPGLQIRRNKLHYRSIFR